MSNVLFRNSKYSTTKLLSTNIPIIEKSSHDKYQSINFLPENKQRLAEGGLRLSGSFKSSVDGKPLVSIVTIVYNGQEHIEETILSVLNQNYDNVEYIIIDGGSADNTLNILRKYDNSIDYWVSEGDSGISDAFNKGIRCCSGEIIGLINADDYYEADSFSSIVSSYIENEKTENVFFGNTNKITVNGRKEVKNDNNISWCISVPFSHCSSFVTKSYYKKYGLFDTKYRIGMDVELLMRGLKSSNYIKLEKFIATQRDGGVSDRNRLEGYKEYREIAIKHFGVVSGYLGYLLKVLVFYKNKVF
ncbi:glycosyltransferase family 2 protein [Glaciecola sp. HTCC2999]|uniref:glycosyltransferase family 2 protein n=1 Tax=Glaciecola sp. HTCC2999 TaxID=455436 RepID=UPI0000E0F610|nr:glycosyltransferase family 2 protein [Glaciecola sp. HTCC2999]